MIIEFQMKGLRHILNLVMFRHLIQYDCVSKLNPASFISLENVNIKSRKVNENNYWAVSRLAKHGVNNKLMI